MSNPSSSRFLPADAYLALGSNVGGRRAHLAFALRRLGELGRITGLSSVWETDPVGFREQRRFLNMVVRLVTPLEPLELLESTRSIERDRGRTPDFRNAPRTLDIDILLHGDRRVVEDGLRIPHPRMRERPFVLVPLLELDPTIADPGSGRPYADDLAGLVGRHSVRAPGPALAPRERDEDDLRAATDLGDAGELGNLSDLAALGVRRVMDGEELLDDGDV
ncbi:MAG: 2-amino-4-hydroxy-6-hydroxymethyldihydropteridine diphosphokinase [Gemmatimonadota bacterium]